MRAFRLIVAGVVAAGTLVLAAPARADASHLKFAYIGKGQATAISDDGRYVVTADNRWHDTATGASAAAVTMPSDASGNPQLEYVDGYSPSLSTAVTTTWTYGSQDLYTNYIGGASAVPSGDSWNMKAFKDQIAAGCSGNAYYRPGLLQSTSTGIVISTFCSLSPDDQDGGRPDTYFWHPDTHTFDLISQPLFGVAPWAQYSGQASASADGHLIVYMAAEPYPGGDRPLRQWLFMWNRSTGERTRLALPDGWYNNAVFTLSPDGSTLAAYDGEAGRPFFMNTATGTVTYPLLPSTLPGYTNPVYTGVFSQNSRYFLATVNDKAQACCTQTSSLVVIDLATGTSTEVHTTPIPQPWGWTLLTGMWISNDGQHMLIRTGEILTANDTDGDASTYLVSPSDTTAPTVTATPDRAPNTAGWYRTPVTLHWTATDPDNTADQLTFPADTIASTEGANVTYTSGPACDPGGNCATGNTQVSLDPTPPAISASTTSSPNAAGWYNAQVTVTYACSDSLSGVASCPAPSVITDTASSNVSVSAYDVAGNSATDTVNGLKVDTVPPSVTISGVSPGAKYTVGTQLRPLCTASDALSGLAAPCSLTVTGGNANGVGTFTATATATDVAGNTATTSTTYKVVYGWNGFLQPINDTAHNVGENLSVFKAGSNVPAKFALADAAGNTIQPLSAPVWVTPQRGVATSIPVDETVYSDPADSGSAFRQTGSNWQYNWKTSSAQSGYYWRVGVTLDDGETHYVEIALR